MTKKSNVTPPPFPGAEAFEKAHEEYMNGFGSMSPEEQEEYLKEWGENFDKILKSESN